MKKIVKVFKYLLLVTILLVITSPVLGIPLINNIVVWRMESELKNIPVPKGTKQIQHKSIVGKLNGNGNGVDYLATLVVESRQSLNELQAYYKSHNQEVDIMNQKSDRFNGNPLERGELLYQKLRDKAEFSNYYTIYFYRSAKFGSILESDIRGH
ncbi:hypothetical protein IW492_06035 [Enterococcus sp. BWB1-3]|uniref:hypothetical protein n=1 Tax=Enterococcus sp. BWB1-3 TaxID=2787713 RepID=UPI0019210F14|nr:hypothetical protein [Enterococcus sp. BWB1-3]MBL1228791.1 hypothetical protein [Enterococcus sp. BWB1-3]